ncbi:MAG: hypothetical protein ACD_73C00593G0004 [uncultured bacterium]|nr:MAG: hypothetical protein ACD_73C00593G0004 [uncultured bacterium]
MTYSWTHSAALLNSSAKLAGVFYKGRVTRVIGLIIEAYLPKVPVGALCIITRSDDTKIKAEVIGLREHTAVLMPIGETAGIQIGDYVDLLNQEATVKVSEALLGRILDGNGDPMDEGPRVSSLINYPLYNPCTSAIKRKMIDTPLTLGVRSIDGFLTTAVGQRMMIMAGSGVGKSTLLGMIARNASADINVIGLIGERGREVREFIERDLGEEGLKRSIIVVATSDAPALVRMRAAFVTMTIAEYFRDLGKNVLVMMDSLTRFAMATREVGLSLGEPPTSKGYTPSLFSILPKLLERAGTSDGVGSITGLYTVLTEADDIQDPIADAVRAIVDGHIVLSRKLNTLGHFPPIDILQSLSRVMSTVVKEDHKDMARKLRRCLALYFDSEDFIKIGIYQPGKNEELDTAVNKFKDLEVFLRQRVDEKAPFTETVDWMNRMTADLRN